MTNLGKPEKCGKLWKKMRKICVYKHVKHRQLHKQSKKIWCTCRRSPPRTLSRPKGWHRGWLLSLPRTVAGTQRQRFSAHGHPTGKRPVAHPAGELWRAEGQLIWIPGYPAIRSYLPQSSTMMDPSIFYISSSIYISSDDPSWSIYHQESPRNAESPFLSVSNEANHLATPLPAVAPRILSHKFQGHNLHTSHLDVRLKMPKTIPFLGLESSPIPQSSQSSMSLCPGACEAGQTCLNHVRRRHHW